MRKHPAALTAAAAALLVFFAVTFAYPLSRMLAQITPEGAAVFSSTVFRRAVGSSCLSGALTVLFALPLAMLMALLTESTRVRCRALWRGIFVLPMLAPLRVAGYGAGTAAGNERPAHAGSPPAGEHLRPAGHRPRTGALHRADRLSAAGEPPALPQPLAV